MNLLQNVLLAQKLISSVIDNNLSPYLTENTIAIVNSYPSHSPSRYQILFGQPADRQDGYLFGQSGHRVESVAFKNEITVDFISNNGQMVFLCKSQNVPQMLFRINRTAWIRRAVDKRFVNKEFSNKAFVSS